MLKRCAFSGHRPLYFPWKENESDPACVHLKAALEEEIDKAVADGFLVILLPEVPKALTHGRQRLYWIERRGTLKLTLELAKPFANYNRLPEE